ncbi:lytic transglycosylase domain-containing protein [Roseateles asaccharophilus]|uniref:Soluble lytic murein transglycosylase-like protein n=1 Tax=Roseateles asaccharophilus TaxID=582607 RepID=A0ABU2A877_9BURK|nr:lytic transglycosylase domain-containing protein [Roseateles asaccharophilus]MDR7333405.1 soluble lytic murein transglycosylase-like protein [Roseateles asaccharophilus]
MATTALAAVAVAAQARPDCRSAAAEDLLDAAPSAGAEGFALTRRLCAAKLVRRSSTAALPAREPVVVRAEPVTAQARPSVPAPAPRPLQVVTTRDASGQARIRTLAPLMADVAQRHDIDPLLLHAVAHIESRHQSQAVSHAGARGLMQVMPATGRGLGVADARDLLTPEANLEASAKYLKQLQARFGNDLALVLAAYNAGEGAVERHGRRVPPFAETQAYVRNVLAVYAELRRWFGGGRA